MFSDRELQCRPGLTRTVLGVGLLVAAVGIAISGGGDLDPDRMIISGLVALASVCMLLVEVRDCRYRVTVAESGLTVRDAAGRESSLRWEEIDEMRVVGRPSGGESRECPISVVGASSRLRVPRTIEDPWALVEEVTSRAGLTYEWHGLLVTSYTREHSGHPLRLPPPPLSR